MSFSLEQRIKSFCQPDDIIPYEAGIAPWVAQCASDPNAFTVLRDYEAIRPLVLDGLNGSRQPTYAATAGAPCTGKSTLLEAQFFTQDAPYIVNDWAYIDPDRTVMEFMNHTYRPLLMAGRKANLGTARAKKEAYETARPGSNIIANLLLNEAVRNGYNIAHGATLTGAAAPSLLEKLKQRGYRIDLMLCDAKYKTREDMRIERNKEMYQVTDEDFRAKALQFAQRMPAYFEHADRLRLYWTAKMGEPAVLGTEYRGGQWRIRNTSASRSFISHYETLRRALQLSRLSRGPQDVPPVWSEIVRSYAEERSAGLVNKFPGETQPTSLSTRVPKSP